MLCSLSAFICMMYSDSSPVFPVGHVAPVGVVSALIYQAAVGNHGPHGPDHMVLALHTLSARYTLHSRVMVVRSDIDN